MGSDSEAHECGAIKETDGEPCTRDVDADDERCWQHTEGGASAGRPSHQPTEVTEAIVEALAMEGHDQETIAEHVGVSVNTLTKHYREILDRAELSANAQVVQTAFAMAVSGNNPSMTRYWLNCRTEQWKNQKNVDVTSDGDKVKSAPVVFMPDNGKREGDSDE